MAAAAQAAAAFDELECVSPSERLESIRAAFSPASKAGWKDWDTRVTSAWSCHLVQQPVSHTGDKHLRFDCTVGSHYHNRLSVVLASNLGFSVQHALEEVQLPADAPSAGRLTTQAALSDLLLYLQSCRPCYGGTSAAEMRAYKDQHTTPNSTVDSLPLQRFSMQPRTTIYPAAGRLALPTDDPLWPTSYEERQVHFSTNCSGLVSGASCSSRCTSCHAHAPSLRATLHRSTVQHRLAEAKAGATAAAAMSAAAVSAERYEQALKDSEEKIVALRVQVVQLSHEKAELGQELAATQEQLAAVQAELEASRAKMTELSAGESEDLVTLLQHEGVQAHMKENPGQAAFWKDQLEYVRRARQGGKMVNGMRWHNRCGRRCGVARCGAGCDAAQCSAVGRGTVGRAAGRGAARHGGARQDGSERAILSIT